jgi:hypothetical protein
VNDSELFCDLVQETFLAALEQYHKFEDRSSERSWLTGILKIKIYNLYKQRLKKCLLSPIFKRPKAIIFLKTLDLALQGVSRKEIIDKVETIYKILNPWLTDCKAKGLKTFDFAPNQSQFNLILIYPYLCCCNGYGCV